MVCYPSHGGIAVCLLLLVLPSALKGSMSAHGYTNVTVDDQDPRIIYVPECRWHRVNVTDVDFGGSHMSTSDLEGYAEIKMTFVSFHVVSALYSSALRATVKLDGTTVGRVDFTDPDSPLNTTGNDVVMHATSPHKVVFSYRGTSSKEHVVRLSSDGASGSVLDALIFEANTASENIPSKNHLAIGLGIGIPVLLAMLAMLVALLSRRKRRESDGGVDFNPNAMGGRPATLQDYYLEDGYVGNNPMAHISSLVSNSLGLAAYRMINTLGDDVPAMVQQPTMGAQTKASESDPPSVASALASERDATVPDASASILSSSPKSTTSLLAVDHSHSRSLPNPMSSMKAPLRPLYHPCIRQLYGHK